MKEKTCEICGKIFLARNTQVGKYCSIKCRGIGVNKPIPVEERIYNFIDKGNDDECWNYIGYKNKDGYGIIGTSKEKNEGAHRIIYKLEKGEIPQDKVVMHTCDNSSCCNPKHLILGTQNENILDMTNKGRGVYQKGENSHFSKLTSEIVEEIRSKYTGKRGEKVKLAKEYGVVVTTITNILNNKSWKVE